MENDPQFTIPAPKIEETKSEQKKQPDIYGNVPDIPTQEAVEGIRFDFNDGIRVLFPHGEKRYRCVFSDLDTGCVLYSMDMEPGALVTSVKKYFIRFMLEIYEKDGKEPIFTHKFCAKDKEVMVQLPVGTIGDSIGWFSYVERFQKKHGCKLICVMTPWIADIFKDQYPDLTFITKEETEKYSPYACYRLGLFFGGNTTHQPIDFRQAGLHRTAGNILGVDTEDIPPRVKLSAPRKIKEKYIVIATQASSQAKYWNNPFGWDEVIEYLKKCGYRIICIDREKVHGDGIVWNHIPNGAEDDTGDKPLQERIDLIKDADMFIGLSSGLSWLAWCCKVPVIMISGFTSKDNEFFTPYRVINYHPCNSCWNDMRVEFDHYDPLWCPRHKGDQKHFECTKQISGLQVINTIRKVQSDYGRVTGEENINQQ